MKYNVLWLYLSIVFIITLCISLIYIHNQKIYSDELIRIKILEEKIKKKKNDLDKIRSMTLPCPYENLNDPRSCFIESNYSCIWNENADRCDKKSQY